MKTLRGLALFLLLPILVAEPVVRLKHQNLMQRFGERVALRPVDIILAGSSRIAAALDESVLSDALITPRHPHPEVINLGRGYSRPHDKALALRDLILAYPEHLRGTWLLIEAPAGIPDLATWHSAWAVSQEPGLITAFLGPQDWWRMAFQSETPPSLSAQVALFRISHALLALRKLRDALDLSLAGWYPSFLLTAESEPVALLPSAGGILSADAAVKIARDSVEIARPPDTVRLPIATSENAFDSTIWKETALLARKNGMKVAFFEPPMSQPDQDHVLSEHAPGTREAVRAALQLEHLVLWPSATSFADSDYPDLLHLRAGLMAEYSRTFAAQFRKAAPGAL